MSALIKSVDALGVRSLTFERDADRHGRAATVSEHQREIAALRHQLASLQAEHFDCPSATGAAHRDGIEKGRELAFAEFEYGRAKALDRLDVGIAQAVEHFSKNVVSVERLAMLIAHSVLDKLLVGSSHYRDLARDAIAAQIREIDHSSIIRMLVSPVNFPDQAELDQLADLCGIDQAKIMQASGMREGHCHIQLVLGTLDVGLRQQWEKLSALFEADLGATQQP